MKKMRVNEIFYSLQGEGRNTGRAAAFIRFSGCNLRCPFCDTEFDRYREMTAEEIVMVISSYPTRFVVLTGGEPTLQVTEAFVDLLHQHGYEVAMESNGTRPAPMNIDWLTVSPKMSLPPTPSDWRGGFKGRMPDEIKIVFESSDSLSCILEKLPLQSVGGGGRLPLLYLQPCDTGDSERNARIMKAAVDYIMQHPQWRLSLQTHKLIHIK